MREPVRADHRLLALLEFLRSETAGGLALIGAAVLALIWSNSPAASGYFALLDLPIGLRAGAWTVTLPLHLWVNDALMALFFLLVALEIRREMTGGSLASRQAIAAPGFAALGGMTIPAVIFALFNRHDPVALRGWAVPVATDIAFSLAVLRVLGRRVPIGLKSFLTALAILDDLGAIVVIAIFYTARLDPLMLALAALLWAGLYGLARLRVMALLPYLLGGVVLWVLVYRSGVHATLAGVALAFAIPLHDDPARGVCPARRLEDALEGPVSFLILPLFGLANAGLALHGLPPGWAMRPLVLGIALGLLLGKQIGVFGATVLAHRSGLARLPVGLRWSQLYGAAILCGIGFTMSLFIGDLAFGDGDMNAEMKLAVFIGSIGSALLGLAVLRLTSPPDRPGRHEAG